MTNPISRALGGRMPLRTLAAGCAALLSGAASAQSLTVLPVNIQMPPGAMATTMTVINNGTAETNVQIRALAWSQPNGADDLTASDDVLASPPIVTIPAGGTQVVRLILRRPPQAREATYRILLDQIPAAAAPGTVRIALRLSIPVFAAPATRVVPRVQYHVESGGGQSFLIASNQGGRHDVLHDITLATTDGHRLITGGMVSPYILAGTTRRWPITADRRLPPVGGTLQLTARATMGPVTERVPVRGRP